MPPSHPYNKFTWAVSASPADVETADAPDDLVGLFKSKAAAERFADLMRDIEPRSRFRVVPI